MQELIELEPGGGMLKLTSASYWRPSGKNIHRHRDADEDDDWGVTPNEGYEVEVDEEQFAKLLSARLRRDVYKPNYENGSSSEDDLSDPQVDPQLAKAVQYAEAAIGSR